jgi:hypothetical protein
MGTWGFGSQTPNAIFRGGNIRKTLFAPLAHAAHAFCHPITAAIMNALHASVRSYSILPRRPFLRLALLVSTVALCACPTFAADEATLTVRTEPPGLQVWLNDTYLGDSPILDKRVAAGRSSLRLVDAVRRTSVSEEVLLQAGQATVIDKTVSARYGSLEVDTRPAGAEVAIETPLGQTPVTSDFMVPGKYRVRVTPAGRLHQPITEDVTIPAGEKVVLNRELAWRNPFDTKAVVRLLLGASAVGCLVWAIVEQGDHRAYETKAAQTGLSAADVKKYDGEADDAAAWRTVGIVGGAACAIGFEVVAFF